MRIFLACNQKGWTKKIRFETFERAKPLYCLQSFIDGEKICKEILDAVGSENFLLDSGAFSFMSGADHSKEYLLEYLDRYIRFINENNVKYFFELDVDTIYGIEFVEGMRKKLENETGKQCIPVWHKSRGIEYWKRMCREYKYVAIGGLVFHVKKSELPLIKKLVDYAYYNGVKVHGLGFTKTRELDDWKFYSVDSASWTKAAGRGQQIYFFNGTHMLNRPINKGTQRVKFDNLISHNYIEWVKYQKFMDNKRW